LSNLESPRKRENDVCVFVCTRKCYTVNKLNFSRAYLRWRPSCVHHFDGCSAVAVCNCHYMSRLTKVGTSTIWVARWPSGWLGGRVVSVPDSGSEEHGFESQSRCCQVTVLGKLFAPSVPRSTQPRIPSESLNRVPASAGVKAGKSPLPGGR